MRRNLANAGGVVLGFALVATANAEQLPSAWRPFLNTLLTRRAVVFEAACPRRCECRRQDHPRGNYAHRAWNYALPIGGRHYTVSRKAKNELPPV